MRRNLPASSAGLYFFEHAFNSETIQKLKISSQNVFFRITVYIIIEN